jgi:hypothetical protein
MIITSFIVLFDDNLQYFQKIATQSSSHQFTIISIEDHYEEPKMKKVTFSFNSDSANILLLDLFYLGKNAGREQYKTLLNETAY